MHRMNKRLKTQENPPFIRKTKDEYVDYLDLNSIDRLSNLPTDLLCHILSFLPTEDAVATSVLSTKWRNLFTLIPNLKLTLYDTLLPNPRDASIATLINFESFMNRLLSITSPETLSIQYLYLKCRVFKIGKTIADWVGAALRHNLKDLDLSVSLLVCPNHLFNTLYGCGLVTLSLCLEKTSRNTSGYRFHLPNLKKLDVNQTEFGIVNGIVEGSPLLECLVILNCYGKAEQNLRIKSHSLEILRVINGVPSRLGDFELDAPNLKNFSYSGFLKNHYSFGKLKSLDIARLDLYGLQIPFKIRQRAVELLSACSDARRLCLSKLPIMAMDATTILPVFPNLVSLTLAKMDATEWRILPKLIDSAPNFRSIIVKEAYISSNLSIFLNIIICLVAFIAYKVELINFVLDLIGLD